MHPQEIYKQFLLKVNKNDTNANVKVPKGVFVILFNEAKRKFLDNVFTNNESTDQIDDISELLLLDEEFTPTKDSSLKTDFTLPPNFLRRTHAHITSTKGDCKDNVMVVWFKKPKDINVLLQNSTQSPSFEYQETLGVINSGKVSVYKTDFSINKLYLSYYFEPDDIDIAGYTHLNGEQSKDIKTQLSTINVEKIIDRTVVEVAQNYEDVARMQMAFQRQQLNEK